MSRLIPVEQVSRAYWLNWNEQESRGPGLQVAIDLFGHRRVA